MDFATVIVTLAGIGLIIFMLWFFLGKNGKPRAQREIAIFRTLRKWGALLLLAVLLVVVAKQTLLRPPTVKVVRVNRRDVVAEVQGTGTVTTNVLARVGSRITGTIQKLYVDERDFVQKGQIIAQIDDSDLRHQVDNAKAQLESARAAAERAQRDWEREKKLVARGVVSCQEADQYQERNLTSQRAVDAAAA